jgi:ribosomal RNA small subunit methyltransferase A
MGDRYSSLASVSATRAVLEAHGLATKKSLGQNFLVNDDVIRRICELSGVGPVDDVVEVGPGIGTLTVALLARARRVVSIERDPDLPAVLAETCAPWADRFTLISNDALAVQPDDLPFAPTAFIANLPYAVAATLVLDYFERFDSIQRATVMVQAEVADRMMAQPGTKNYGAYTVKLALFARPASRFKVAPGNFFPPPHVDSAGDPPRSVRPSRPHRRRTGCLRPDGRRRLRHSPQDDPEFDADLLRQRGPGQCHRGPARRGGHRRAPPGGVAFARRVQRARPPRARLRHRTGRLTARAAACGVGCPSTCND